MVPRNTDIGDVFIEHLKKIIHGVYQSFYSIHNRNNRFIYHKFYRFIYIYVTLILWYDIVYFVWFVTQEFPFAWKTSNFFLLQARLFVLLFLYINIENWNDGIEDKQFFLYYTP